MKKLAILLSVLITTFLPLTSACTSAESIAIQVAKEWTSDSDTIIAIADEIADLALENIPGVTSLLLPIIKEQVVEGVSWTYSTAVKTGENRYKVTAKSTLTLDLSLLGSYGISVDFPLTVDTVQREVDTWTVDAGSFDFSKLD